MMRQLNCGRCGANPGLLVATEDAREWHCWRCGFADYGGAVKIGRTMGAGNADLDFAALVRKWAADAGLAWDDAEIGVSADSEGAGVSVSGAEGADDFAERWKAAFGVAFGEMAAAGGF